MADDTKQEPEEELVFPDVIDMPSMLQTMYLWQAKAVGMMDVVLVNQSRIIAKLEELEEDKVMDEINDLVLQQQKLAQRDFAEMLTDFVNLKSEREL